MGRNQTLAPLPQGGFARVKSDPCLILVFLTSLVFSVGSFIYFFNRGETLLYTDAQSHLLIAERAINSPTAGYGQYGGVWLPLQHILMYPLLVLPFGWGTKLYETGIAGSVVSMLSFILCSLYLYLLGHKLSGSRRAGVVTAFVVLLNPNILYMQTTPMSELLLYLFVVMAIYYLTIWCEDTSDVGSWFKMGISFSAACLTRYESWFILAFAFPLVLVIFLRQGYSRVKLEGRLLGFGVVAPWGLIWFLALNTTIFGNPLIFQNGEYAKPSNWVSTGEKAVGNWQISAQSYWIATYETVGLQVLVLGIVGVGYYLWQTRREPSKMTPLVLVAAMPIFFVLALYKGQRPLHVSQISGELYNLRFALIMVLPVAIFCGYIARKNAFVLMGVLAVVGSVGVNSITKNDVVTLNEPLVFNSQEKSRQQDQAALWFRENYKDGGILLESYGNERLQFASRMPLAEVIYEGSFRIWEPALKNPASFVDWVVMKKDAVISDKVAEALAGKPVLTDSFTPVFENQVVVIYASKQLASQGKLSVRLSR